MKCIIYKIINKDTVIHIGNTTEDLEIVMNKHKNKCSEGSEHPLFKYIRRNVDWNDVKYECFIISDSKNTQLPISPNSDPKQF